MPYEAELLRNFRGGEVVNPRQKPSERFAVVAPVEEIILPTEVPLVEQYEAKTFRGRRVFDLPRPRYLVPKLILEGSLVAIYGQKGQGKTHYTLALALELARGGEWNGYKLKARPVYYLVGEGSSAVVERLEAWEQFHGEELPDNFETGHLQPAPQLTDVEQIEAFIELLKRRKWKEGALIILDTFQTATIGLDEISGKDMGVAIESLKAIGREAGATIAIVHHAGKQLDRGQRGHSSLGASVETELEIRQDNKAIVAKVAKMRTAPDGHEHTYRLDFVQLAPVVATVEEADGDEFLLEARSVPVLVATSQQPAIFQRDDEKILLDMLEGFDLPDGYKRRDAEKAIGKDRSSAGSRLKKLKGEQLVTTLSPFTNKNSTSSYWLTDEGRAKAKELEARFVASKIAQQENGN